MFVNYIIFIFKIGSRTDGVGLVEMFFFMRRVKIFLRFFCRFRLYFIVGSCYVFSCNGGWGGDYLLFLLFIEEVGRGKKG